MVIQYNEVLKSKFKEEYLMNSYRCFLTENIPCLRQNVAYCGGLFGSTYICDQNLKSVVKVATTNIIPDVKTLTTNMKIQK